MRVRIDQQLVEQDTIGPRRGRLPGEAIRMSGHKADIDAWLFRDRLPLERVSHMCLEQLSLRISDKALRRYVRYVQSMGVETVLGTTGSVTIERMEGALRNDWDLVSLIITAGGKEAIDASKITIEHRLKAIAVRQKMLGQHNALTLITSAQIAGEGIEAIMEVMQTECDPATLIRIQQRLLEDPRFRKALSLSMDGTVDAHATVVDQAGEDDDDEGGDAEED